MRRPQITRVDGGQIDINAPNAQAHTIYEDIHLYRQQRIHHHHMDAEHIFHDEAAPVEIDVDPTQVHVHVTGPQAMRVHGQREEHRGTLRHADQKEGRRRPQFTALPSPPAQGRAPALPAPRQAGIAPAKQAEQPLQIADQRQPKGFWGALFSAPQKVKR